MPFYYQHNKFRFRDPGATFQMLELWSHDVKNQLKRSGFSD